jgi:hypothetical protein
MLIWLSYFNAVNVKLLDVITRSSLLLLYEGVIKDVISLSSLVSPGVLESLYHFTIGSGKPPDVTHLNCAVVFYCIVTVSLWGIVIATDVIRTEMKVGQYLGN